MPPKTREEMMQMGLLAMTPEEAHAARVKGGKATAAKFQRKKKMQELAQAILDMKLQNADELAELLRLGGLDEVDVNNAAGIIMAQALKALRGDTKAAEYVRDTSGQKPVDGLVVGNLDDRPFETLNLAEMTDEQLRALADAKAEEIEETEE